MITYIDTSVLIKLIIDEDGSDEAEAIWDSADALVSAATLVVEARAALAAAWRAGRLTRRQFDGAKAELAGLIEELALVEVDGELIEEAAELAEQDALRGYDALHLAAALRVGADVFSSADTARCRVAGSHSFPVANPLDR